MRNYGRTNVMPYTAPPPVGNDGDVYWNSSNKNLFMSDGTQWIQQSTAAWGAAWGIVGTPGAAVAAGTSSNAIADLANATTTVTPVVGRRYVVFAEGLVYHEVANARARIYIRDGSNTILQGGEYRPSFASGSAWQTIAYIWTPAAATATTFKISYGSGDTGNANIYADTQFVARIWVEDAGPAAPSPAGFGTYMDGFRRRSSSADITVATSTWTDLPVDQIMEAYGSTYTYSAANKDITIPSDGLYEIHGAVQLNGSAVLATNSQITLIKNANEGLSVGNTSTNAYDTLEVQWIGYLKQGDKIKLTYFNGNAGNVVIRSTTTGGYTAPISPTLSIWRVGAGLPGPPGPDITAAQSSYFYGVYTPAGSGNMTNGSWNYPTCSTVYNNNMTLASGTRITINQTGRYLVMAQMGLYASSAATQRADVLIDHRDSAGGIKQQRRYCGNQSVAAYNFQSTAAGIIDAVAGDYVQIGVLPYSAGIQMDFGGQFSWVEVVPVGGVKGDIGPSGGPVPTGGTAGQVIVKNSPTDFDVFWRTERCYNAGGLFNIQWSGTTTTDQNLNALGQIVAAYNGWIEVHCNAYATCAQGQAQVMLYSNTVSFSGGGAVQASLNSWGPTMAAGSWVSVPCASLYFPVSAGANIVLTARGMGQNLSGNCFWNVYGSWKLYAS